MQPDEGRAYQPCTNNLFAGDGAHRFVVVRRQGTGEVVKEFCEYCGKEPIELLMPAQSDRGRLL